MPRRFPSDSTRAPSPGPRPLSLKKHTDPPLIPLGRLSVVQLYAELEDACRRAPRCACCGRDQAPWLSRAVRAASEAA